MGERHIDYMKLEDIAPAILNPKTHHQSLASSMDAMGFTEPMLLDDRTGRLIAGHGRLEELQRRQKFGEDPPDGVQVVDGSWTAPVVRGWSSKDDAHATAALLGSNQITIAGDWRQDEVAALLAALEEVDPALVLASGFDEQSISDAINDADTERMLEPEGNDDWEQVTLRLPPDVALMFRAALDTMGGTESESVRRLVEAAAGDPAPPF